MKKALQYIFLIGFLVCTSFSLQAQPHPGKQNGGGDVGGNRIGDGPSGAPVGNGTFILFALALAYAGRKYYEIRTAEEEEKS